MIIKSLKYPFVNIKDFIVVGFIFCSVQLIDFIGLYFFDIHSTSLIGLITIILDIFIFGFLVSIVRHTIKGKNDIPIFYLKESFIQGIKAIILKIFYFLIPCFIIYVIVILNGYDLNPFYKLLTVISLILKQSYTLKGAFNAFGMFELLMEHDLILTSFVALILFIIFDGLSFMSLGRLAETGSFREGLRLSLASEKLKQMGLKNYTMWYIEFILFSLIFIGISSLVAEIPYIGLIIVAFVLTPYYFMFKYREIGLIYTK
ncbi:MAG: DUF4013 domain-containing protein [Methanobacteriaceae archaeon]|nr:DUF4013 domain-containing protein [Methanobacteriaceae archaeon]